MDQVCSIKQLQCDVIHFNNKNIQLNITKEESRNIDNSDSQHATKRVLAENVLVEFKNYAHK